MSLILLERKERGREAMREEENQRARIRRQN